MFLGGIFAHGMGNFRKWLTPKWVDEWANIYRQDGFKGLLKKKGWMVIVAFILFYLIRDSIIYIIIPYLIYRGATD